LGGLSFVTFLCTLSGIMNPQNKSKNSYA